MSLFDILEETRSKALQELHEAVTLEALEAWNADTLGRKGAVTLQARSVGTLPQEERPDFGRRINEVKQELEAAYAARIEELKHAELSHWLENSAIDVTLPGRPATQGRLHVTTNTLRQIYAIFAKMGFEVYEAPDVELEAYNSTAQHPGYHRRGICGTPSG